MDENFNAKKVKISETEFSTNNKLQLQGHLDQFECENQSPNFTSPSKAKKIKNKTQKLDQLTQKFPDQIEKLLVKAFDEINSIKWIEQVKVYLNENNVDIETLKTLLPKYISSTAEKWTNILIEQLTDSNDYKNTTSDGKVNLKDEIKFNGDELASEFGKKDTMKTYIERKMKYIKEWNNEDEKFAKNSIYYGLPVLFQFLMVDKVHDEKCSLNDFLNTCDQFYDRWLIENSRNQNEKTSEIR